LHFLKEVRKNFYGGFARSSAALGGEDGGGVYPPRYFEVRKNFYGGFARSSAASGGEDSGGVYPPRYFEVRNVFLAKKYFIRAKKPTQFPYLFVSKSLPLSFGRLFLLLNDLQRRRPEGRLQFSEVFGLCYKSEALERSRLPGNLSRNTVCIVLESTNLTGNVGRGYGSTVEAIGILSGGC